MVFHYITVRGGCGVLALLDGALLGLGGRGHVGGLGLVLLGVGDVHRALGGRRGGGGGRRVHVAHPDDGAKADEITKSKKTVTDAILKFCNFQIVV